MRRFVVRFVLATLAAWLASFLLPGITTDRAPTSFLLFGLFLAVGEVALPVVEGGAAVLLFFLPRSVRTLALRTGIVAIASALVSGFGFSGQPLIGLIGFAIFLSLVYMLPLAH